MIAAAKGTGRHGHRDAALALLTYRHAGRVSEVVAWRRVQVDLEQGTIHVNCLKNWTPSVHPLRGPEIRALRRLFREHPDSQYGFCMERKGPMTAATARKIIARAGELAGLGFPVHTHMLRHATATTWPPRARAPGRSRRTLGIRTSSTPFDIRNWHRGGSRISGGTEL